MQPKMLTCVTAIAAVCTLSISIPISAAQEVRQTQRYYVFNLGDPGGGNLAAAASINNIGWIDIAIFRQLMEVRFGAVLHGSFPGR
jgi:hypothetical protein